SVTFTLSLHDALPISVMLGLPAPVGVLAAAFAAAGAIGALGVRLRERDVAIGSVLAFGMGLGVLFLTLSTRYATEAFSILFGSRSEEHTSELQSRENL